MNECGEKNQTKTETAMFVILNCFIDTASHSQMLTLYVYICDYTHLAKRTHLNVIPQKNTQITASSTLQTSKKKPSSFCRLSPLNGI